MVTYNNNYSLFNRRKLESLYLLSIAPKTLRSENTNFIVQQTLAFDWYIFLDLPIRIVARSINAFAELSISPYLGLGMNYKDHLFDATNASKRSSSLYFVIGRRTFRSIYNVASQF